MNIVLKRNDTYAHITLRIPSEFVLNGAKAEFLMQSKDLKKTVKGNASIEPANTLSYSFKAGDTTDIGEYIGEFRVTLANGTVQTFPKENYLSIKILPSIDAGREEEISEEIAIHLSKIDSLKEEFYREKSALYEDNDTFKSTTSGLLDEKIEIFDREIEKATPYHVGDTPPVNKGAVWYKTV